MIIYACKEDRIMASRIVRIESITIDNFKNVTHGTLDFENKRKDYIEAWFHLVNWEYAERRYEDLCC